MQIKILLRAKSFSISDCMKRGVMSYFEIKSSFQGGLKIDEKEKANERMM